MQRGLEVAAKGEEEEEEAPFPPHRSLSKSRQMFFRHATLYANPPVKPGTHAVTFNRHGKKRNLHPVTVAAALSIIHPHV